MRPEGGALLAQLAQVAKAEDLEAAAVGQDGSIPAHERMQAAELLDQLRARPQHQVIGVGEDDLRACLAQFFRRDAFDGGLRADGHEDGRRDGAVRGLDGTRARPVVGAFGVDAKRKGW